jgi:hypothetical protein
VVKFHLKCKSNVLVKTTEWCVLHVLTWSLGAVDGGWKLVSVWCAKHEHQSPINCKTNYFNVWTKIITSNKQNGNGREREASRRRKSENLSSWLRIQSASSGEKVNCHCLICRKRFSCLLSEENELLGLAIEPPNSNEPMSSLFARAKSQTQDARREGEASSRTFFCLFSILVFQNPPPTCRDVQTLLQFAIV